MDRGAWRTTVHRVSKSWTRLKRLSTQTTQIFFPFIFISWRLITLQYCSGFCHALTWISHGFTCVPHPDPLSHLPNNTNLFILQFWRKWVIWGLKQGVGRLVSLCSLQGSGQESSSSPFPASRGTHSPWSVVPASHCTLKSLSNPCFILTPSCLVLTLLSPFFKKN